MLGIVSQVRPTESKQQLFGLLKQPECLSFPKQQPAWFHPPPERKRHFKFDNSDIIMRYHSGFIKEEEVKIETISLMRRCFDAENVEYLLSNVAGIKMDPFLYHLAIERFERAGSFEKSIQAFEQMRASGICPNKFTLRFMLSACENAPSLDKDKKLIFIKGIFLQMCELHVEFDVGSFFSLIDFCKSMGNWRAGLWFLRKGVDFSIFLKDLGLKTKGPQNFVLNFHEGHMESHPRVIDPQDFSHEKGVSLNMAELVLLHHINQFKTMGISTLKLRLIVGYHGRQILKTGLKSFIEGRFFSSEFSSAFDYFVVPDSKNPGVLILKMSRKDAPLLNSKE